MNGKTTKAPETKQKKTKVKRTKPVEIPEPPLLRIQTVFDPDDLEPDGSKRRIIGRVCWGDEILLTWRSKDHRDAMGTAAFLRIGIGIGAVLWRKPGAAPALDWFNGWIEGRRAEQLDKMFEDGARDPDLIPDECWFNYSED